MTPTLSGYCYHCILGFNN